MNVLLIIPNLNYGGAQVSLSKLSHLISEHHNVFSVVFKTVDEADIKLAGTFVDLNVPGSSTWIGKLFNFIIRVRRLKAIKLKHGIDVSISFLEGADYVNILAHSRSRVIVSVRGSKLHDQNIKGLLGWIRHEILIPFLYQRADSLVALTEGIKKELIDHYKITKPIYVIPNAFDVKRIKEMSREEVPGNEVWIFKMPVIACHGRIEFEKGYDLLLEVFRESKELRKSARLLFIGDGTLKHALMKYCALYDIVYWDEFSGARRLQDVEVCFLGYRPNPFMYLSRSSVFVFPSRHEGFGNSLAEAMICGVPVIASDCPYGPREILEGERNFSYHDNAGTQETPFGILIKNWHAGNMPLIKMAWCSSIIRLLQDRSLAANLGSMAAERMKSFDSSGIGRRWLELIESQQR